MSERARRRRPGLRGFLLIEVLVALAIFGAAAFSLADMAASTQQFTRSLDGEREMEHDLRWARGQIFAEPDYEKLEQGGEVRALSLGEIRWEAQVEMTKVVDVYKVTLTLDYDGSDELGIEPGERVSTCFLLRPTWSKHGDFSSDRASLLEDKRDKIREIREDTQR